MLIIRKKAKAQSIAEYAALIIIVSVAFGVMFRYIQRGIQVRVRHLNQELNDSLR
ncbi:MAG: hypothetical protein PHQ96_04035 [Candidatus Omnitrophica bacterium]|nr:hypothetical protein [Candidatus Omnitrophota bacterium]